MSRPNSNMKAYVQVLGSCTGDSGPTLLIWFDKKRYVFNCSEGFERLCSEHGIKPSKLDTFFFTRLSWENTGGFAGILYAVGNVGTEQIHLFGPPNTINFVEAMRYFLSKRKLTITTKEFRDPLSTTTEIFEDENIKIHPILLVDSEQLDDFKVKFPSMILQSSTELRKQDNLAFENIGHPTKHASFIERNDKVDYGVQNTFHIQTKQEKTQREKSAVWPPKGSVIPPLRKLTKDTMPLNSSLCYICHTTDTPGKFDAAKANQLGVPIKQRATLVKGNPVTLDDGRVIQPNDCIGPSTPGVVMMIIDCPNLPILQALVSSQRFSAYQQKQASNPQSSSESGKFYDQVVCIIHMTPSDILTSPQYQQWMNTFHPETQHIVINEDHCARKPIYHSSSKQMMLLNHIHPDIFPLHYHSNTPKMALPHLDANQNHIDGWPKKMTASEPLVRFCLAPKQLIGIDKGLTIADLDKQEILKPLASNPDFNAALSALKEELKNLPAKPAIQDDPVDVLFLGTGSANPSKYRNQSSTYIHIRNYGGLLLDAGEGTLGQLSRHYGEDFDECIANLKFVFISHMHGDHHLGLMRIILRHSQLSPEPLLIVGPPNLRGWLFEYSQIQPISYYLANTYDFSCIQEPADSSIKEEVLMKLEEMYGIVEFKTSPVFHCQDAFGVSIVHKDGWKIVFSGDTKPCGMLESLGKDATLLIHEATFEDSMEELAHLKRHCTTSDAIQAANAMNAKFLMMTHFSQRYPKIPSFDTAHGTEAGIAFDLMFMKFSDFNVIPKLRNCLQYMFSDADQEDDAKTSASSE